MAELSRLGVGKTAWCLQADPATLVPEMIDLLEELGVAVYPGTQAHQALAREGRVTGGMLALAFEPREVAVKRFRAALIRLRLQAIGRYGVNTLAHDVAINVALARRLGLRGFDPSLETTLASALEEVNRARLGALSTALALACTELDDTGREQAMLALILSLRRELLAPSEKLQQVQQSLEGSRGGPLSPSNLMFASAMATGFLLCLSSATACGGKTASSSMRHGDGDAAAYVAGGGAGNGGSRSMPMGASSMC